MDNQPLFKDSNFTITNELFINGNTRYSLRHLCSIKLIKSRRQIPYTFLIVEILLIATGYIWDFKYHSIVSLMGLLGLIASIALYVFIKPVHKLTLGFASGDKEVIGAVNYAYLEGMANAFSRSMGEIKPKSSMIG